MSDKDYLRKKRLRGLEERDYPIIFNPSRSTTLLFRISCGCWSSG